MEGFFSWFKSGNKIKRWLFLILLAMISICYAMSIIMATDTLDMKNIIKKRNNISQAHRIYNCTNRTYYIFTFF